MLSALHAYLHADTGFWQQFPLGKLASWTGYTTGSMATWYRQGDFISPHNDMVGNRGVSFVLSMTKGWERDFGGSFYWLNGQSHEVVPEFNTLVLFMPSPRSIHVVSPVTYRGARQAHRRRPSKEGGDASGGWQPPKARSRFAVSGWFEFVDPQAMKRGAHYLAAAPPTLLSVDSRDDDEGGGSAAGRGGMKRRAKRKPGWKRRTERRTEGPSG